jgi:hypothetical protein
MITVKPAYNGAQIDLNMFPFQTGLRLTQGHCLVLDKRMLYSTQTCCDQNRHALTLQC